MICSYLKSEKLAKDNCHREDVIILCPHLFLSFVKFSKIRKYFLILIIKYVALAKSGYRDSAVHGNKLDVMGLQFEMISSCQILCGDNENAH